ncbi:MAG: thiosulfate/3-mercaptopyruvate sulfurtransferase [Crocinitomicaceae bacterium]|jgi:thiosulfate/3-mercaptopyruvate sulfurtransferase
MTANQDSENIGILPLILEPSELQMYLGRSNLLILDLGKTYDQAHIPGAIRVAPVDIQLGIKPGTGKLPTKDQLSILFSRLGLTADTHVVVYDDEGGPWAGRMIWVLDSIGHSRYSFLNGGIHSWLAEKRPVELAINEPIANDYSVNKINTAVSITQDELLTAINEDSVQIWDARSYQEYTGEKVSSARGGHLPGAQSYEFTRALDMNNAMRLRALDEIKAELNALAINGEKDVVSHCQTHRRSGISYVVCKALGWHMKAYDGSWSEWGNDPSTPIETGP